MTFVNPQVNRRKYMGEAASKLGLGSVVEYTLLHKVKSMGLKFPNRQEFLLNCVYSFTHMHDLALEFSYIIFQE